MKQNKNKKNVLPKIVGKSKFMVSLVAIAILSASVYSCDSNLSFTSTRSEKNDIPSVSASLIASQSGFNVRITNISSLPKEIVEAQDINVAFDATETALPVTKNSDGTLSFSVSNTIDIDSSGNFNVIFITNKTSSYIVKLKTGPILKLNNPGILVTPDTGTVILGEKVKLTANTDSSEENNFTFNWFYGTTTNGPFLPISGTSANVSWTPKSIGNYFIKLDMVDNVSGVSSSFLSPVSLVFVTDADSLINVSPSSGNIKRGEKVSLVANIPRIDSDKFSFRWSYSSSLQAPFQTISGNSKEVQWTPDFSGSFLIRVEATNNESNETSTYTTSDSIVLVTESDDIIKSDPELGNIIKGESIDLIANVPSESKELTYSWSYGQTPNGPWQSIAGSDVKVNWTPPTSGSFYAKVDAIDKESKQVSTFVSPKTVVFVSEASNVFKTTPVLANIKRGRIVDIKANIPGSENKNFQYNWSFSASNVGPFQPMTNIISNDIKSSLVKWRPPNEGTFFVKVDAVNINNSSVVSFTSPNPIVFVSEQTPLFTTDPTFARIKPSFSVTIKADLQTSNTTTYAWSYGPSTVGPWVSIGGTTVSEVTWKSSSPKQPGTYYVKVDLSEQFDNKISTFISSSPIIFIDAENDNSSDSTFGNP